MANTILNGREVTNLTISGVDFRDYPDFCDAHFDYAEWADTGVSLTDMELDKLAEKYPEIVNEMANEYANDSADFLHDLMMDR